jgi:hypothetical protein
VTTVALALLAAGGCHRAPSAASGDESGPHRRTVRVPAGLLVARSLDTLSVSIDPASLAQTEVTVTPGMTLGVESRVALFPEGAPRPAGLEDRVTFSSGADFDPGTSTWSAARDGVPGPDRRYVAEMTVVLFETDVPPGRDWDPHGPHWRALWTRTLDQAEE